VVSLNLAHPVYQPTAKYYNQKWKLTTDYHGFAITGELFEGCEHLARQTPNVGQYGQGNLSISCLVIKLRVQLVIFYTSRCFPSKSKSPTAM